MFLDEISDYVAVLSASLNKLLVVGDFNFHWLHANADADATRLKDMLESTNMSQFVRTHTHNISGHILDLVIARPSDNLVDSVNVGSFLTDHAAIHCSLNLNKPLPTSKQISYRK